MLEEDPGTPRGQRRPCPKCGSSKRLFKKSVGGSLTPRKTLRMIGRAQTSPRRFVEVFLGADWSYRLGRYVNKLRRIERRNDLYRETVVDPETGEVLKDQEGSLSGHTGHGSAKKRAA